MEQANEVRSETIADDSCTKFSRENKQAMYTIMLHEHVVIIVGPLIYDDVKCTVKCRLNEATEWNQTQKKRIIAD